MGDDVWARHREIWKHKPILRNIYGDWYGEIARWMVPGITLELGGGTGNLKHFSPRVISTDIVRLPWLDAVADAQALPFPKACLSNIILVDVLHHIEQVQLFFDEAERVLLPGGRLVILEPYISWVSWLVYSWLHPEPVNLKENVLAIRQANPFRQPFDGNQAVATILFQRQFEEFQRRYPDLEMISRRRLACLVYPLSGGFSRPALFPEWMFKSLMMLDRSLETWSSLFAFRLLAVLQKRSPKQVEY